MTKPEIRKKRLLEARSRATHTHKQWRGLCDEFKGICVRCLAVSDIQKDHIIPICLGGSDGIDNLQPLCRTCNMSKGPELTNWVQIRRNGVWEKLPPQQRKREKQEITTVVLDAEVRKYMAQMGAAGGRAGTGAAKARPSCVARKAVNERWRKAKEEKTK